MALVVKTLALLVILASVAVAAPSTGKTKSSSPVSSAPGCCLCAGPDVNCAALACTAVTDPTACTTYCRTFGGAACTVDRFLKTQSCRTNCGKVKLP